jgi:hypothetical protein
MEQSALYTKLAMPKKFLDAVFLGGFVAIKAKNRVFLKSNASKAPSI